MAALFTLSFLLLFACAEEPKEQTKEARMLALQKRAENLAERWEAHKKKKETQPDGEQKKQHRRIHRTRLPRAL